MSRLCRLVLLVLVSCAIGGVAMAQQTTGDIRGTVTDSSGAVVPGVKVTIARAGTGENRSTQTNSSGDYEFNALEPGHYSIRIENRGFKTVTIADLVLVVGDHARMDAQLQVGNVSETVPVSAAVPALETQNATLSSAVTEHAVQDLPLNGRNYITLAQDTAGANPGLTGFGLASGSRPDDRRQDSDFSVNGQSDVLNNELIDGMDNNERIIGTIGVRPSIDAIQEFRVETNLYSTDTTRTAGGVVNIVTKSGSNQFHGSLYEFFRNDVLDARNFFANTGPKPELRQNQYGGSLGGPIKKGKTFFFGDYEGFRQIAGQTVVSTVPTLFEEQNPGNFTDIGGPDVSGSVTPVGLNYFKLYPAPNRSVSIPAIGAPTNNFVGTLNRTQFSNTYDARVDHDFNESNQFFARFTYNGVNTFTPGELPPVAGSVFGLSGVPQIYPGGAVADFAGQANQKAYNGQLNFLHVFTPNLILELKAGYTRIDDKSQPLNGGFMLNNTPAFAIPGTDVRPDTVGLAEVYFPSSPYAVVGDGIFLPLTELDNTFQYRGSVTYVRGRHTIKTGADLIRRQASWLQNSFGTGLWLGVISNPTTLASLLTGGPFFVERSNELLVPGYRTWEPGFFVQDDWRATRWLTLNLGVRYDIFTPFTEAHNGISNFDPATNTILVAGVNASKTAGIHTDYKDVAPRLGFAATLGHGTVVRGGFGMSYFPTNYASPGDLKNPPFVGTFNGVITFSAGFPAITPVSATNPSGPINAEALNYRSGYLEQFNLQIAKQLGSNVFTVGYVGNLGRHLGIWVPNLNEASELPNFNPATLTPNVLPFPNLGQVQYITSEGSSSYNALQAIFVRRYANGLTLDANYNLAHGIDDVVGLDLWGGGNGGYGALVNQISAYERGNSDLMIHQRFSASVNYEIPFGKSITDNRRLVLSGWQVNLIETWQTGAPFSVTNSAPASGIAGVSNAGPGATDRPDRIFSQPLTVSNPSIGEWFNVNAFVTQTSGPGTAGRNILFGPDLSDTDFSVFKNFSLHERLNLQFRAEFFNLFNHPNFGNPNAALGLSSFGTISGMAGGYSPREIQFALKLLF